MSPNKLEFCHIVGGGKREAGRPKACLHPAGGAPPEGGTGGGHGSGARQQRGAPRPQDTRPRWARGQQKAHTRTTDTTKKPRRRNLICAKCVNGQGVVGRERASIGARPARWTRDLDGRGDSSKPTHVQRSQQRYHGDVTAVAPHVLTGKHYVG